MKNYILRKFLILVFLTVAVEAALLVPMDEDQEDHLRAYGLAYSVLKSSLKVDWYLNYRGGSFVLPDYPMVREKAKFFGVTVEALTASDIAEIETEVQRENMDKVVLEKAPKVAIYSPPGRQPWDDAVTLALAYSEIPYDVIWDDEIQDPVKLKEYDWLHLHHEDFSGQFGKFWYTYHNTPWYLKQVAEFREKARSTGLTVREHKALTARRIRGFVATGGFLFAMCSATDTLDIALACEGYDFIPPQIDGTSLDPAYRTKMDFTKTLVFQNFSLVESPVIYEHSTIDVDPRKEGIFLKPDTFSLFEFSAKIDTIPCLLNQNHRRTVKGFLGQTTAFQRQTIKDRVVILGETPGTDRVKYLHGVFGEGFYTFLGGHDPEDYRHLVGDPPTDLAFHRNSPGYRLILNNILLPAARRKDLKT